MRCSIGEIGSAVCLPSEERTSSTLSSGVAVTCPRLSGGEFGGRGIDGVKILLP